MKHFLSLGAGVQSSTMALMAAAGEITPMPDAAIFADTQWEPKAVYDWLGWLEPKLPFPVHRVTAGDLWKAASRVRTTKDGQRSYIQTAIPIFMASAEGDGLAVRKGIGKRQCTRDYKIRPVERKARELSGLKRARKGMEPVATMWIGISADEAHRAKPGVTPWITRRHPLLEKDIDRLDCLEWMHDHGYPEPPRSACIWCPFRDDASWLALAPDEFATVVAMESQLQLAYASASSIKATPYFHETLKPLREVKFHPAAKDTRRQRRLFSTECEGMCGV